KPALQKQSGLAYPVPEDLFQANTKALPFLFQKDADLIQTGPRIYTYYHEQ
ncbi:unnamed protein product, partial [marine sediment metagenome]